MMNQSLHTVEAASQNLQARKPSASKAPLAMPMTVPVYHGQPTDDAEAE